MGEKGAEKRGGRGVTKKRAKRKKGRVKTGQLLKPFNNPSETPSDTTLAHQNRTIAIASDFRVDGDKTPKIPQKEGVLGSEIAARNRKSLATFFHRTLKSQCSIAFSCLGNRSRFLGSAMGIAIANRKNRYDFGALPEGPKIK